MGAPDLKKQFDSSTLSTAATRIADVARTHDYTILADPNHTQPAIYELAGKKETMHALAEAGVKHIAIEMLSPAEQPLLDAYQRGEISDRTMEYMIKKRGQPSLVKDYLGLDDTLQNNAYYDLVANAKKAGIKVHGVNASEGVVEPEIGKRLFNIVASAKLQIAYDIEDNPKFWTMSKKKQGEFAVKSLYDLGMNDDKVKFSLENMGLRRGELYEINTDVILKRLEQDNRVAERIIDVSKGEKTLVIYGQAHFLRTHGDVDSFLPNNSVINVYTNQERDAPLYKNVNEQLQKLTGLTFDDKGDYTLDFGKKTWKDEKTGEMSRIAVPAVPSIKSDGKPEQEFTPVQAPPVTQPLPPNIRF